MARFLVTALLVLVVATLSQGFMGFFLTGFLIAILILVHYAWKLLRAFFGWFVAPWKREEEPEPEPEPEPPITAKEEAERLKEQYETTIQMLVEAGMDEIELNSAKLKAKQKYLREIDKLL